jgi:hypothetical protein
MELMAKQSLFYSTDAVLEVVLLMLAMFCMVQLGLYLRRKSTKEIEYMGALEGSSYGLLGLIMAFTFGMAVSRFDTRRQVVIDEVNNISNAMLRVKMFKNDSISTVYYKDFKELINLRKLTNRAKVFENAYDSARTASYLVNQRMIIRTAQLAADPLLQFSAEQMTGSLLRINDSITLRYNVMNATVPEPVFYLLFAFALACSSFSGFSIDVKKKINWIPVISYILFTGLVVYIILDIDRPKRGLVTLAFQYDRIAELSYLLPPGI